MAVRQYVGARYVPKFYQNSQTPSSSEWEGNKAYEAMTIVTYNSSSYTSKIPVPASIGNPAQNPTYWVNTADYNAQVEQYRQQTEAVQNTVNANTASINSLTPVVNNKYPSNLYGKIRMIVIGDSYAYGYTPDGNVTGWPILLKRNLGLSDDDFYSAAIGSAGFKAIGVDGHSTFLTLLQGLVVKDPDTINCIVVAGGYNDSKSPITPEQIGTSEAEFITFCHQTYKNARIYVGFLGWTSDPTVTYLRFSDDPYMSLYLTCDQYFLGCNGATFINGSQFLAHNPEWLASDGVHPNATGQVEIAHGIGCAIFGNSTPTLFNAINVPTSSGDNLYIDPQYSMCNGETSVLQIRSATYSGTLNDTDSVTLDGDHYFQIGTITKSYVYGSHRNPPTIATPCFMKIGDEQTFSHQHCNIKLDGGKIMIAPKVSTGSGWNKTSINTIILPTMRFVVNSVGQF